MKQIIRYSAFGGATLAIAAILFFSFTASGIATVGAVTGNAVKDAVKSQVSANGIQEVALSYKNYQYLLEPSTLTKGVPVRMTVDLATVNGCLRDIVIASFGVRKRVAEGDNIIEFTPDKAGTFTIACSMNMGRGTFEVVEPDGTQSSYQETAPSVAAGAASCGASGSGCGCGGTR